MAVGMAELVATASTAPRSWMRALHRKGEWVERAAAARGHERGAGVHCGDAAGQDFERVQEPVALRREHVVRDLAVARVHVCADALPVARGRAVLNPLGLEALRQDHHLVLRGAAAEW